MERRTSMVKKVVNIHLALLISILIIMPITGFLYTYYKRGQYTELSIGNFKKEALLYPVQTLSESGSRLEIILEKNGKQLKYFTIGTTDEREQLINSIINHADEQQTASLVFESTPTFEDFFASNFIPLSFLFVIVTLPIVWLFVMIDLLKSEFLNHNNKWIWIASLILLPIISPYIYAYIADEQKDYNFG